MVKNLPAMQETEEIWLRSLRQEDPLEKGMASHSSILAWKIPGQRSQAGYSIREDLTRMSTAHDTALLHQVKSEGASSAFQ